MLNSLETGIGLEIVLRLQEGRTSLLESLVLLLDALGGELFFIAILALIYWSISKKYGVRMYFALMAVTLVVFVLKDLLDRPRPYHVSQAVMPVFEEEGFGIPSGHTAMALVLWGYLAYWLRRTWVTVLVVLYVLLQAWGRVYAGVHFPQDVVAGFLLGVVLLALYIRVEDAVAAWWLGRPLWLPVVVAVGVALVGLALSADDGVLTIVGLLAGGLLGVTLETKSLNFAPQDGKGRRAVHYISGLLLSVALLFGLDVLFAENEPMNVLRVVRYALVALFALWVWPLLSVRIGLLQREDTPTD